MSYQNKGSMAASAVVTSDPDRSGNYVANGTADDVEIQLALDDLTHTSGIGVVEIIGDFVISDPIVMNDHRGLRVNGTITAADDLDDNMLENGDATNGNHYVLVEGGLWNHNKAQQTAGHIFYFRNAGSENGPIYLRNVMAYNAKEDTLYVHGLFHKAYYQDMRFWSGDNQGIFCRTSDATFERAWLNCADVSGEDNFDIEVSYHNVFRDIYMTIGTNGARNMHINSGEYNRFYNLIADVCGAASENIRWEGGANNNTIHGATFTTNNMNNSVGLFRFQDSLRNRFYGVDFEFAGADQCTHYIVEGGASDWNIWYAPTFETAGRSVADTVGFGANSATVNPIAF